MKSMLHPKLISLTCCCAIVKIILEIRIIQADMLSGEKKDKIPSIQALERLMPFVHKPDPISWSDKSNSSYFFLGCLFDIFQLLRQQHYCKLL